MTRGGERSDGASDHPVNRSESRDTYCNFCSDDANNEENKELKNTNGLIKSQSKKFLQLNVM